MAKRREDLNSTTGAESAPKDNKRRKPRVLIYKNEDGTYDFGSMTPEDRAKLFVNGYSDSNPTPPEPAPAPAAPPAPIDPAMVGALLNLVVSIEAQVVAQKMQLPPEVCLDALQPRPPFDTRIAEAAARVLDKYGATLGRWGDEIALGIMVITWQTMAFSQLRAIAAEQAVKTARTPPPNVDATRHASPPPEAPMPPKPAPKPAPAQVVPIDILLGAQANTQSMGAGV